ncbi:hypothetical protein CEXT_773901 [Caerostris extrusa]|uniref:Uncharacterized protein n=1 Tax=Caerostris extrusa TaxID=172846 RepID=A0AAV4RFY7_CAEEX|nr:hypothetical protein CEXT_773901 [Caerostris extrusa]
MLHDLENKSELTHLQKPSIASVCNTESKSSVVRNTRIQDTMSTYPFLLLNHVLCLDFNRHLVKKCTLRNRNPLQILQLPYLL